MQTLSTTVARLIRLRYVPTLPLICRTFICSNSASEGINVSHTSFVASSMYLYTVEFAVGDACYDISVLDVPDQQYHENA